MIVPPSSVTVIIIDDDFPDINNLVEGTRTSQVILSEQTPVSSSVPTELYPSTTPLIIIDDDVIRFRFDRQQPFSYVLMEGDTLRNNISIVKYGNDTTLTLTVTPVVVPLSLGQSSLDNINVIGSQFTPQVTRGTIVVEIPDDSESEDRKVFNLTITNSAVKIDNDDVSGVQIAIEGDPIQITVYDNDFEIGFTQERFEVPNGSGGDICVKIFSPREIHPSTKIHLSISQKIQHHQQYDDVEMVQTSLRLDSNPLSDKEKQSSEDQKYFESKSRESPTSESVNNDHFVNEYSTLQIKSELPTAVKPFNNDLKYDPLQSGNKTADNDYYSSQPEMPDNDIKAKASQIESGEEKQLKEDLAEKDNTEEKEEVTTNDGVQERDPCNNKLVPLSGPEVHSFTTASHPEHEQQPSAPEVPETGSTSSKDSDLKTDPPGGLGSSNSDQTV